MAFGGLMIKAAIAYGSLIARLIRWRASCESFAPVTDPSPNRRASSRTNSNCLRNLRQERQLMKWARTAVRSTKLRSRSSPSDIKRVDSSQWSVNINLMAEKNFIRLIVMRHGT